MCLSMHPHMWGQKALTVFLVCRLVKHYPYLASAYGIGCACTICRYSFLPLFARYILFRHSGVFEYLQTPYVAVKSAKCVTPKSINNVSHEIGND